MQIDLLTTSIASFVALIVGVLSFLASVFKNRAEIEKLRSQLQNVYNKSIFDKRMDAYTKAWLITGKLSSLRLKSSSFEPVQEIKLFIDELRKWYDLEGGVLLSIESRDRYFLLRKSCMELTQVRDVHDLEDKIKDIWRYKMNFRNSLRKELFLEEKLFEHQEEEWDYE